MLDIHHSLQEGLQVQPMAMILEAKGVNDKGRCTISGIIGRQRDSSLAILLSSIMYSFFLAGCQLLTTEYHSSEQHHLLHVIGDVPGASSLWYFYSCTMYNKVFLCLPLNYILFTFYFL